MRNVILIHEPESGGYSVIVPGLPGCHTQGERIEDALANAREAMELWLEVTQELDHEIPPEDDDLELGGRAAFLYQL